MEWPNGVQMHLNHIGCRLPQHGIKEARTNVSDNIHGDAAATLFVPKKGQKTVICCCTVHCRFASCMTLDLEGLGTKITGKYPTSL